MVKTFEDYLEDPRMADMANEPYPVKEVHVWRLMNQDERESKNPGKQETAYRAACAELNRIGIPLDVSWQDNKNNFR
jgi:hypothetical protein